MAQDCFEVLDWQRNGGGSCWRAGMVVGRLHPQGTTQAAQALDCLVVSVKECHEAAIW